MSEVNRSRLVSIAVITSLLTCGLLAPFWTLGLFIIWITDKPNEKPKIEPVTIMPSDEFVDDWEFRFYEVERN